VRKLGILALLLFAESAVAQILAPIVGGGAVSEMDFTLPAPNATFNLTYTNSGATLHWIFPAGSVPATIDSNNPTVNAAAGVVRVQSRDEFKGVTSISDNYNGLVFTGTLPTLPSGLAVLLLDSSTFTGTLPTLPSGLTYLGLNSSTFTGTLPALPSGLTAVVLYASTFTGTLPTLPSGLTCLGLYASTFTGTLPALPSGLTYLDLHSSTFTGYTVGGFATQASLSTSYLQFANVADVNSALVDAATSLGISGRVVCNPFWIAGSSPAPTGAGIAAKATLISAGWTVTTN
jgi:hypothetical protein